MLKKCAIPHEECRPVAEHATDVELYKKSCLLTKCQIPLHGHGLDRTKSADLSETRADPTDFVGDPVL